MTERPVRTEILATRGLVYRVPVSVNAKTTRIVQRTRTSVMEHSSVMWTVFMERPTPAQTTPIQWSPVQMWFQQTPRVPKWSAPLILEPVKKAPSREPLVMMGTPVLRAMHAMAVYAVVHSWRAMTRTPAPATVAMRRQAASLTRPPRWGCPATMGARVHRQIFVRTAAAQAQ